MKRVGSGCLLVLLLGGMAAPCFSAGPINPTREPQSLDDLFVEAGPSQPDTGKESAGKEPASLDDLFVDTRTSPPLVGEKEPASLDELFVDTQPQPPGTPGGAPSLSTAMDRPSQSVSAEPASAKAQITGFYQNALAYTYAKPKHWSKFRNTLDLSTTGQTEGGVSWKFGGRVNYDPIYDLTNFYPSDVRDDQRLEADIREAYVDFSQHDWEFRLGRQHIVWGEMVGLFFADVVSARDMRELVLPDFDMIRIPQWAARAEYFKGDFHGELVWIPYMTYDDIGEPGAEFYPFPAGTTTRVLSEDDPKGLSDSAYGARLSYLKSGWDVSGFYYSANDPTAAFARVSPIGPVTDYRPVHKRIHQWGATVGKDLGPMVVKGEAVYTSGKQMSVTRLTDRDSLVKQDVFDYIVGLEWSFPEETRLNVQFFQRFLPDRDPDLVQDTPESGASFMFSTQALHPRLEPKVLFISSLDHRDWLAQYKLTWKIDGHWRAVIGADVFSGTGVFGYYGNKDRIYSELRYSF